MGEIYGILRIHLKGIQDPVKISGVQKETSERIQSLHKHFVKHKGRKNDGYACVTFEKGAFTLNLAEVQMLHWYQD